MSKPDLRDESPANVRPPLKLQLRRLTGLANGACLSVRDYPPGGIETARPHVSCSKLNRTLELAVDENSKTAHIDGIRHFASVRNGWKAVI